MKSSRTFFLFTYSGMCENMKSASYDEFISVDEHELRRTEDFVVDGYNLLHAVSRLEQVQLLRLP